MSVLRNQDASVRSEPPGILGARLARAEINDMKVREIKGFPAADRSRALNGQHNFANMFAGLHAPMCVRGLFQRECAVHQGWWGPLGEGGGGGGGGGGDHRRLVRI